MCYLACLPPLSFHFLSSFLSCLLLSFFPRIFISLQFLSFHIPSFPVLSLFFSARFNFLSSSLYTFCFPAPCSLSRISALHDLVMQFSSPSPSSFFSCSSSFFTSVSIYIFEGTQLQVMFPFPSAMESALFQLFHHPTVLLLHILRPPPSPFSSSFSFFLFLLVLVATIPSQSFLPSKRRRKSGSSPRSL